MARCRNFAISRWSWWAGGDSALEEATYLTRFASQVYLVHRRDSLRASVIMQKRALKNPKIKPIWNTVITEVLDVAAKKVTGVKMKNIVTGETSTLDCAGVFVAIGHVPNTAVFGGVLETDEAGYLKVGPGTRTNVAGVFAAGDVADSVYRQAITAAGYRLCRGDRGGTLSRRRDRELLARSERRTQDPSFTAFLQAATEEWKFPTRRPRSRSCSNHCLDSAWQLIHRRAWTGHLCCSPCRRWWRIRCPCRSCRSPCRCRFPRPCWSRYPYRSWCRRPWNYRSRRSCLNRKSMNRRWRFRRWRFRPPSCRRRRRHRPRHPPPPAPAACAEDGGQRDDR